jgi:hypothetical protein
MHEGIKEKTGIEKANCSTCELIGSNDDGNFPEFVVSWPCCDRFEQYQHLKSFPFKKEMKCWQPSFWHSKFADMIKTGTDEEMNAAADAFQEAVSR